MDQRCSAAQIDEAVNTGRKVWRALNSRVPDERIAVDVHISASDWAGVRSVGYQAGIGNRIVPDDSSTIVVNVDALKDICEHIGLYIKVEIAFRIIGAVFCGARPRTVLWLLANEGSIVRTGVAAVQFSLDAIAPNDSAIDIRDDGIAVSGVAVPISLRARQGPDR